MKSPKITYFSIKSLTGALKHRPIAPARAVKYVRYTTGLCVGFPSRKTKIQIFRNALRSICSVTLCLLAITGCKQDSLEQLVQVNNTATQSSSSSMSNSTLPQIYAANNSRDCTKKPFLNYGKAHHKANHERYKTDHFNKHQKKQPAIKHVIHISVDGLSSLAVAKFASQLPTFKHLIEFGAFTLNARTDDINTFTLPNHISQLTGLYVTGDNGHNWTINSDLAVDWSIHDNKGYYLTSIFDVVHDFGLSTAMFASKSKFHFIRRSWDVEHGSRDQIGEDNGTDKIDMYAMSENTDLLLTQFKDAFVHNRFNYSFIHLHDLDSVGHSFGWSLQADSEYIRALHQVDTLIGELIEQIDSTLNNLANTVFIITSDHGGIFGSYSHNFSREEGILESAIIPFFVYGSNIPPVNLYDMHCGILFDPGELHPVASDTKQPIRNGHTANFALNLLGLPMIPESTMTELAYPWYSVRSKEPRPKHK